MARIGALCLAGALLFPTAGFASEGGMINLDRSLVIQGINFLLLLDYWIMPWLAVLFIDFFWLRRQDPAAFGRAAPWNASGLVAYLVGLGASVPFMAEKFFTGPLARWVGGADFSYFIGFIVAGAVYLALTGGLSAPAQRDRPTRAKTRRSL